MQIRKEEKITYANVPAMFLDKLEPIFRAQGFEYELLYGLNIPEDQPQCVDIEGRKIFSGVCCVKSHMNAEDVHRLMLSAWSPTLYGRLDDI